MSASFVEPRLEQLLRLSAIAGLDTLARLDIPVDPMERMRSRQEHFPGRCAAPVAPVAPSQPDPPNGYRVADAVVGGLGVIPGAVLTGMCRALGTTVTRALVDMRTGATVETADKTYKPGTRLRRFVVTRDQHCRFPGCTRPARLDDVDHVTRWPDGPAAAWNLQCLCRHHHRAEHEGGWSVSMTPDGVCTWTSPSGRHYTTHPAD